MATSVDNHRQFRLDMNNVIRPLPRSDSPNRNNNNFSNTKTTNKPQIMLPTSMSKQSSHHHDDSDSEEPDDSSSYWVEPLKKSVSEILEPSIHDPRDDGTSDSWIERNPSLIRLTGKHPFNSEPPLQRLMSHGFITPTQIHYVRNHGAVPQANFDNWSIEVTGLVRKPKTFTMNDLITKFKSIELPVTLVCAGNRRKEQNMVKQSIGFNWGAAAVSTSVWRGVCLVDVLKECGIMSRSKGAMNVCFEGAEDLPGGGGGGSKYGTSLKIEVAMDPSRDVMLAYMQNGEILEPDHGFPVRVIIPGFIGGRMVKWLKRIVVSSAESDSYYHFKDNRVLPSHVDAELANAEAWWYKPEYIINELNINSVITTPCHEEILPINSFTSQRSYTLKGYAYSGGGRKVTRVEVTMDGGETWHVCQLDIQEKPNKYGKYWCWCFWELEVEVLDLLAAKQIAVRAWDESLNTQPEKLIWNVMGMMNNCWFKVKTNVCRPHKGEIGIVFEHPTQPGNKPGGWMARERHIELTTERQTPTLKKSMSSPFINTATKMFSISEVKKHSSSDSAWIVVHGHVYDCTRFLKEHPGGADSILINAGTDCTEEFDAIHSDKAKKLLEDFRIGELITTGYSTDSAASSPNTSVHGGSLLSPTQTLAPIIEAAVSNNNMLVRSVALIPRQKIPCKLIEKVAISHDVRRFRFALPERDQVLGLPVGKHIFMCAMIDGKLCMRAYTPTSSDDEVGYFELVVKIYYKDQNPRFPNGGMMSQYLESLEIESVVEVKGPLGHIEYSGKGNFRVHGKVKKAHKLSMIAGGTGITPIYQIMQAILKDPEDETEMYVVYANRTEDDILLKDELDGWAKEYPERVQVWYVVQESIHDGWKYDIGFVTEGILRAHVPMAGEGVLALTCGPPPMIQFAVQPNLEKMGYDIKEELLVF